LDAIAVVRSAVRSDDLQGLVAQLFRVEQLCFVLFGLEGDSALLADDPTPLASRVP
jgi:hypothetical protein